MTDVNKEFWLTYGELDKAWRKKKEYLSEEMADVAIYLLGLSGIDLENEIQKKVYKNTKREYKVIDAIIRIINRYEGTEIYER